MAVEAETTPIYEKPSLRCAAGRFQTLEEALRWALVTADERYSNGGLDRLEISRYWAYPDGLENGTELFEVSITGTVL